MKNAVTAARLIRICNALVIYYKKMRNMDMEVVIINEELGL